MKKFWKTANLLTTFSVSLIAGMANVYAAPLSLSDKPLFLGNTIEPNVFFDVDDSGSMDWEVLTVRHWESCAYSNQFIDNVPSPNPDICGGDNGDLVTSGLWIGYEVENSDDPTDPGDTGFGSFEYIYSNSDSAYSHFCRSSRETIEECASAPGPVDVDWRVRSSQLNVLYYDPEVNYKPWIGTGLGNASFFAAKSDPQPGTAGFGLVKNLTGFVYEIAIDDKGFSDFDTNPSNDKPRRGASLNVTNTGNGMVDLWDSHIRYTVNAANVVVEKISYAPTAAGMNVTKSPPVAISGADFRLGKNPDGSARTVADVQQNVANWYEYSRRRSFATKGAIAQVITNQPGFRYGLTVINEHGSLFKEVPTVAKPDFLAHNQSILNDLFSFNWPARGTPLRQGLQRAGQYYDGVLSGKKDPIISECQQNFSVLFTDGFWNGNTPSSSIGNADGDGYSQTVADVAKFYYDRDLNPFPNVVPASADDPNQKQHMVTFTVAFGVQGNLVDTDNDGVPNPVLTESGNWGNPFNSNPAKIDDLWHAAFNSKGTFVSARTPLDVENSLRDALGVILSRTSSASAVATNSTSLNAGAQIFQARFDSGNWSGEFEAILISDGSNGSNCPGTPLGQICPTGGWEVNKNYFNTAAFDFDTGRRIITYHPTEKDGIKFRWPSDYTDLDTSKDLDVGQVTNLLANAPFPSTTTDPTEIARNQAYGDALVDFLRGDDSNEGAGLNFRKRLKRLGDIVSSDPVFVGAPAFRYPDSLESVPYSSFKKSKANRTPVVYVGANDGMLHAFHGKTGQELLAYVPGKVYENLPDLANPSYAHKYFVNGAPTAGDAFFSTSSTWHTVLVSGLAQGGQGIFALDITDPGSAFDESKASNLVLWEFTDADDPDLGFTFSQPAIVKMANGKWAAVFGNGYNNTYADSAVSTTGHAVLYIVDIEDGSLIRKITTNAGSVTSPNGMSTTAPVDVDGDDIIDLIYAGDLNGNLWKFDVSSSSPLSWKVDYGAPIFKAVSGAGVAQPITSRPNVGLHPKNQGGYMVYFGTGKYIENGDNLPTGQQTQTFYGIWDKDVSSLTPVNRGNLLKQTITHEVVTGFDTDDDGTEDTDQDLRTTSDNQINWTSHMGWYIDLINTGEATPANDGEKQITNSVLRNGRIIYTTLIPSPNPCDFGGTGWLMELDAADGSKLDVNPFDFNNDGDFDSKDNARSSSPSVNEIVSGKKSKVGIISQPTVLYGTGFAGGGGCFGPNCGDEFKYTSGSSGGIGITRESVGSSNYGRQTWREISR